MSSISAGTTLGTGLVSEGDTTGELVLKTNGGTTAVTIGTDQSVAFAGAVSIAGGALPAASGGTGLTSPGTAGNVLTSNGTAWTSAAAAAFDSGTVMLFGQTAAPTGWTKDTSNNNNSALRVVTGTASTGGSVDFTTAFASQTPSGTVSVSGSAGNTTLSTPQIPSHSHPITLNDGGNNPTFVGEANAGTPSSTGSTNAAGGGGSHNHPLTISSSTFSGNAINLAVKYVDVIRATKN
jgi:hypothetical protein